MAKRYAIWIARRECSDAIQMVEDIERLGWKLTGRRQQLLVDQSGKVDGFSGAKIPKKLWGVLPRLMAEGQGVRLSLKRGPFGIGMSYFCVGNLCVVDVNWKSAEAPEDVFYELFLPLATGLQACFAALVFSEADWWPAGFQMHDGVVEVRAEAIDWIHNEHEVYLCESQLEVVRGVRIGSRYNSDWFNATLRL
ncbi:MAG: hypothetical protein AAFV77_02325 [Planctomycetota bacterium]